MGDLWATCICLDFALILSIVTCCRLFTYKKPPPPPPPNFRPPQLPRQSSTNSYKTLEGSVTCNLCHTATINHYSLWRTFVTECSRVCGGLKFENRLPYFYTDISTDPMEIWWKNERNFWLPVCSFLKNRARESHKVCTICARQNQCKNMVGVSEQ